MRIGAVGRACVGFVAIALTLVGCGGEGSTEANTAGLEKTTLTVGLLPIPDVAPIYLAIQKGYFKQEGLTVKPELVQGTGPAVPKLVNGSLDVVLGNYVSVMTIQESGTAKLKIIADTYQARPKCFIIMVPEKSPRRTPRDLKGAKIAVNTPNSINTLAVEAALRVHDVKKEEVKFVQIPFPSMPAALKSGQVDAAWMTEPFITASQAGFGARVLTDTMTGAMADFPIAGWVATEQWTGKYPKTMAAFQRALLKAQRLAASDRREVVKILPTYTKIPASTASLIALGDFPVTVDPGRIQRVADLMHDFGYLKSKPDVRQMVAGLPS